MDIQVNDSASERFRCDWLLPYLKADKYTGIQRYHVGNTYDAVIFQKAYRQDWIQRLADDTKGVKIFDITDPEHLFRPEPLKKMLSKMDVIVTSTETLATDMRNISDKPVYVIPDRHELGFYTVKKKHQKVDKPVLVWFGYADNYHRIYHLLPHIQQKGYELITICEREIPNTKFIKWGLDTVNEDIIKGDIVLNPPDLYYYKSNNKTISSWLLGMPVAETVEDIERLCAYEERIKESEKRHKEAIENYNISKSADEYIEIIKKHKKV